MPALDVSDAFDPDFFDGFTIFRRVDAVGDDGFAINLPATQIKAIGVVTMASPNDLERLPEADVSSKSIVIVTMARLQLGSPGIKADLVYWGGEYFQVKTVEDYSRYGLGYIFAIATAVNYLDPPPVSAPVPPNAQ